MKKGRIYLMLLIMGLFAFTLSNCGETEPLESCAQEEFCTGKNVSSCCTEDACVYKYDGKEYSEGEETQLYNDLGCTGGGSRVASEQEEQVIYTLKALMAKAKSGLQ